MIIVKFENPPGVPLETTQFSPGQPLHITAAPKSALGGPAPLLTTSLEIKARNNEFVPYYSVKQTNLLGNVEWDLVLPNVIAKADVIIIAHWPVTPDKVIIPIGIGTSPPPPPDTWQQTLLKVALIGGGALILIALMPALVRRTT